jgi:hypothetical protein
LQCCCKCVLFALLLFRSQKTLALQLYSNIIFKRITALLVMGLIVFIYTVKVFHTHSHHSHHSDCNEVTVKSICATCNYHFIKDADEYTSFTILKVPASYHVFDVNDIYNILFTTSETTLLRGPPTIA